MSVLVGSTQTGAANHKCVDAWARAEGRTHIMLAACAVEWQQPPDPAKAPGTAPSFTTESLLYQQHHQTALVMGSDGSAAGFGPWILLCNGFCDTGSVAGAYLC